jgi:hypothetical protein
VGKAQRAHHFHHEYQMRESAAADTNPAASKMVGTLRFAHPTK